MTYSQGGQLMRYPPRVLGHHRLAAIKRLIEGIESGHGLQAVLAHYMRADRGRGYGRPLMRGVAALCRDCRDVDARDARLTRMHSAYRRRR